MQWTVHGERQIYSNPWVNLWLVGVQGNSAGDSLRS